MSNSLVSQSFTSFCKKIDMLPPNLLATYFSHSSLTMIIVSFVVTTLLCMYPTQTLTVKPELLRVLEDDGERQMYSVYNQLELKSDKMDLSSWDPCSRFSKHDEYEICSDVSNEVRHRLSVRGREREKNTWVYDARRVFSNIFGTSRDCWTSLSDEIDVRCEKSADALDEYLKLHTDISRCLYDSENQKTDRYTSFTDDPAADAPYKALKVFLMTYHVISNTCNNRFIVRIHRQTSEIRDLVQNGFAETKRQLVDMTKSVVSLEGHVTELEVELNSTNASIFKCLKDSEVYRNECETNTFRAHQNSKALSVDLAAAEQKTNGTRSLLKLREVRIDELETEVMIMKNDAETRIERILALSREVAHKDGKIEELNQWFFNRVMNTVNQWKKDLTSVLGKYYTIIYSIVALMVVYPFLGIYFSVASKLWSSVRVFDIICPSKRTPTKRLCDGCGVRPPRCKDGIRTRKCQECVKKK